MERMRGKTVRGSPIGGFDGQGGALECRLQKLFPRDGNDPGRPR